MREPVWWSSETKPDLIFMILYAFPGMSDFIVANAKPDAIHIAKIRI